MNWFNKLMIGRYGGDHLSTILILLSLLLSIMGRLTGISLIWAISYIPLGISILRMFSRDINKRSMENYKFAIFMSPIYSKLKTIQRRLSERKTHRFFKCPNCKTKLRIPKGKGNLIITCPQCKTKFNRRT